MNTISAIRSHRQGLTGRQNRHALVAGFIFLACFAATAQNTAPPSKPGLKRLFGFSVEAAMEHLPRPDAGKSAAGSPPENQAETPRVSAGIARHSTGDLYGLVSLEQAEKYLKTRRTKLHQNGVLEEVVGYLVPADGNVAPQVHDPVEEIAIQSIGGYLDRYQIGGTSNDIIKIVNRSQNAHSISIQRANRTGRIRGMFVPPNGSISLPLAGSAVAEWNSLRDDVKPDNFAHAFVSPTPLYSTTDTNGVLVIKGVPVGRYTLRLRHKTFRIEHDAAVEVVEGDNFLPLISVRNNNTDTSTLRRILVDPPTADQLPDSRMAEHRARRQYWDYLLHLQRVHPWLILERVN